jgi:predicted MFS family arabinose efflux permease
VYALTLTAWILILPLIAALRFRSRGEANRSVGVLRNIGEGMRYTARHSTIFAVISIVVVLQAVGMPGPATLGPVWMTNVLGLSKAQFGVMAMTWGLGTLAASFFFAWMAGLMRRGTTLCATTLLFAVCALVFAYSRNVPLTALANFGLGFALIGTMVSASTIVQHTVSEEMRGRVLGLFPLAMSLSMLGGFPVSGAAQAFGMPVVYAVLAWAMLGLIATIVVVRPALRRVGRGEGVHGAQVALALE